MSFPTQPSYIVGGLCAVMSISDVEAGDLFKSTLKELSVFSGAAPKHMLDAIIALDVAPGLVLGDLLHAVFNRLLIVTEG